MAVTGPSQAPGNGIISLLFGIGLRLDERLVKLHAKVERLDIVHAGEIHHLEQRRKQETKRLVRVAVTATTRLVIQKTQGLCRRHIPLT